MACFVVATLLVAASAGAQEVGYKDLTKEDANPLKHNKFIPDSSCDATSGALGMGTACPPKTYPFELLLVDVDRSELQVGGEVIAMLRLRNVGHDPASVPWITDSDEIELPDEDGTFEFFEADLRANIVPDDGGTVYIGIPVHLYGAKEIPGSLQEVRPGEYIELRITLALDCRAEEPHCKFPRGGSASLSFTWTELDARETYEKCGIYSIRTEIRELTSSPAVIRVIEKTASQPLLKPGSP